MKAGPGSGIELALARRDVSVLTALIGRSGAVRRTVQLTWHDTPDRQLRSVGLALCEVGRMWRLERIGTDAAPLAPGMAATVVAEAADPSGLGHPLPGPLHLVGSLRGSERQWQQDGVGLRLVVARDQSGVSHCRLLLEGAPDVVAARARDLAASCRLSVAEAPLTATLTGLTIEPPSSVRAPASGSAEHAAAWVMSGLARTVLHWGRLVEADATPDAIHQLRVALRRMRSALQVFAPVIACPQSEALAAAMRDAFVPLGAVRDLDVFLDGMGHALQQSMPEEAAIEAMLAQARRQRDRARGALRVWLRGPEWRCLAVLVAAFVALRPWTNMDPARPVCSEDITVFGRHALRKRWHQVAAIGKRLDPLPTEALHDLRKRCKRLRYAAEFLQAAFPARRAARFVRDLAKVQEALGLLNDGAVAAGLVTGLEGTRPFAAGALRGYAASDERSSREQAGVAWKRLRKTDRFWK